MAEPVPGISATPDDNNARYFHVVVAGPSEVSNYISDVTFLFFLSSINWVSFHYQF